MANKVISFTMLAIIAQAMLLALYLSDKEAKIVQQKVTTAGVYIITVDDKGNQQVFVAPKLKQSVKVKL